MNTLLSLIPDDLAKLKQHSSLGTLSQGAVVFILCAAWCGTCASFKKAAADLAKLFPQAVFIWLDIEDDSEVAGDVDVVNFPSLAVFREGVAIHYGVSLPHQGVVKRLLTALLKNPVQAADVPEEVRELPEKLQDWLSR